MSIVNYQHRAWLAVGPATFIFSVLLVIPIGLTLALSFQTFDYNLGLQPGLHLNNYIEVISDSYYQAIFVRTLVISLLTMLICVVIGVPEAYILYRMKRPWRSIFLLIVIAPLLVSLVVRAFGWSMLLGSGRAVGYLSETLGFGPILYTQTAVVIALVHVMLPFMVIPVWTSLQKTDPATGQAALSLGASLLTTWCRVIAPQIMPGILSGTLIVFGLCTSSFAIPALLGGRRLKMVANVVYDQYMIDLDWALGAAVALILLALNLVIMLTYNTMVERYYKKRLGVS